MPRPAVKGGVVYQINTPSGQVTQQAPVKFFNALRLLG